MVRYRAVAKGRVQGVGFRAYAAKIARDHRLTGWVANLSSGDVEMEVQGERQKVELFLALLYKGNGWMEIESLHTEKVSRCDGEERFLVRHG